MEAAASLRDVVIRSNAIVPGYIETPMISGSSSFSYPLHYNVVVRTGY